MRAFRSTYAKIETEYKPQKPDGTLGGAVTTGWNIKENKKVVELEQAFRRSDIARSAGPSAGWPDPAHFRPHRTVDGCPSRREKTASVRRSCTRFAAPLKPRTRDRSSICATRRASASSPRAAPPRGRRSASRMLRREVARDLEALVNTVALESTQDLDRLSMRFANPFSIMVFPTCSIARIDEAGGRRHQARDRNRRCKNYEPRLVAGSIRSRRDASVDTDELKVRFFVRPICMCSPSTFQSNSSPMSNWTAAASESIEL